jgi:hypothetical protein
MDGEAGQILRRFALETLREYWPPERRHVEEGYRNVPFPFERIPAPPLSIVEEWTLDRLAGYVRTWSSSARYRERHGVDAVVTLEADLMAVWGKSAERRIEWPLVVLAGRVSG